MQNWDFHLRHAYPLLGHQNRVNALGYFGHSNKPSKLIRTAHDGHILTLAIDCKGHRIYSVYTVQVHQAVLYIMTCKLLTKRVLLQGRMSGGLLPIQRENNFILICLKLSKLFSNLVFTSIFVIDEAHALLYDIRECFAVIPYSWFIKYITWTILLDPWNFDKFR